MYGRVPVLLWHCRKASERSLWSVALNPSSHLHQGHTLTRSHQPLKQAENSPSLLYRSPRTPPIRPCQGCWLTLTPGTFQHRGYIGVRWPVVGLGQSTMTSYPFFAEYAKRGQAKCKTCKEKCEKGEDLGYYFVCKCVGLGFASLSYYIHLFIFNRKGSNSVVHINGEY